MPRFLIKSRYLVMACCSIAVVLAVAGLWRERGGVFLSRQTPVVIVATFYQGMPSEQVESSITEPFKRFFTLGNGIDHVESSSLQGLSLIRIFFQAGSDPDVALATVSRLAKADQRWLPPGTASPIILKFDASSLPGELVTPKGEVLSETRLRDLAQYGTRSEAVSLPLPWALQFFTGNTSSESLTANAGWSDDREAHHWSRSL